VKISFSLLAKFVDLSTVTPQELAERLTMSGMEVAGLEDHSLALDHVVVGRIKSVSAHPNADKLSLTEVEIPGETLQIVCGAKNIAPGDVVPVALEGALLPGDFKIKRAKIRGVESRGMICSEKELGLAESSEGIMHLPADAPLGTPVAKLLGGGDAILEVELTPNRPDCLSHLGIARQVSAILNLPLTLPQIALAESEPRAAQVAEVQIEAQSGCGRYCARVIRGVQIGSSPEWLKSVLERLGSRSINNVVDVTNYVMLELGHPLHAFDLSQLEGARIVARSARPQETLVTLDGQARTFQGGELVIADKSRPVALAGVMGGLDSEVKTTTTDVLLEAAWFEPAQVRKAARSQNLSTEASYRFERGTDPENGLLLALDRAAQLIAETAGGKVLQGVLNNYPLPATPVTVKLNLARAEQVLGMPLEKNNTLTALSRLGFLTEATESPEIIQVRVPSFRQDVSLEEDLIEEIAQVLGFDRIPTRAPQVRLLSPAPDPRRVFLQEARRLAAGLGLNEVINYSFLGPTHFARLGLPPEHPWRQALSLKNPLNEETSLMRPALLPGLVETAAYNQRRGQERIFIFESGAVFVPRESELLPDEPAHWGLALTGQRYARDWRWGKHIPDLDFYDLKGILEAWLERLPLKPTQPGGTGFKFQPKEYAFLHPAIAFALLGPDGREIGWAGALHPEAQAAYKLKDTLWVAEIDLETLFAYFGPRHGIKNFSRFPSVARDLAMAVPETTPAGDVVKLIRSIGGPLLVRVDPFDVYRGNELPPQTKSLAFALTFQAQDRTLQDEEIKTLHTQIVDQLQKSFGAQQR
jgi:phenylalanyl-tRNA synthetase beta chain